MVVSAHALDHDTSVCSTLAAYHRDMRRIRLLTPEETQHLADCIEQGRSANVSPHLPRHQERIEAAERAKRRLVEANLRLVVHMARQYQGFEVDLMDLIQEGNLGLLHAVEKYDYRKGSFATYARWWIRQAIARALIEQSQMIHIPLYRMEQIKRLRKVRASFAQRLELEPQPEDLAGAMGISRKEVQALLALDQTQEILSLEAVRFAGDDRISLGEVLEEDPVHSPEQVVMAHTLRQQIEHLLQALKPRERRVLRLRYGFEDGHSYTLLQTAKKMNLSSEGVRQAEARALKILAPRARSQGFHLYLTD